MDAAAVVALVALDGSTRNIQHIALGREDAAAVSSGIVAADVGLRNGKGAALGINTGADTKVTGLIRSCLVVCYGRTAQGDIGSLAHGADTAAAFAQCGRHKPVSVFGGIVPEEAGRTTGFVAGDGAVGDGEGAVKAVDAAAQAMVAGWCIRRNIVCLVALNGGTLYRYGGVVRIDTAAASGCVALNGAGLDGKSAVPDINTAACTERYIGTVFADSGGRIVLNGAAVNGGIFAVFNANAAIGAAGDGAAGHSQVIAAVDGDHRAVFRCAAQGTTV